MIIEDQTLILFILLTIHQNLLKVTKLYIISLPWKLWHASSRFLNTPDVDSSWCQVLQIHPWLILCGADILWKVFFSQWKLNTLASPWEQRKCVLILLNTVLILQNRDFISVKDQKWEHNLVKKSTHSLQTKRYLPGSITCAVCRTAVCHFKNSNSPCVPAKFNMSSMPYMSISYSTLDIPFHTPDPAPPRSLPLSLHQFLPSLLLDSFLFLSLSIISSLARSAPSPSVPWWRSSVDIRMRSMGGDPLLTVMSLFGRQ